MFVLCWQITDPNDFRSKVSTGKKNFRDQINNNQKVPVLENMMGVAVHPVQDLKAFGELKCIYTTEISPNRWRFKNKWIIFLTFKKQIVKIKFDKFIISAILRVVICMFTSVNFVWFHQLQLANQNVVHLQNWNCWIEICLVNTSSPYI